MSKNKETTGYNIGFFGFLTLLFIGLKLTNYIDWSWEWVLAPIWLPVLIGVVIGCIFLFIHYIFK